MHPPTKRLPLAVKLKWALPLALLLVIVWREPHLNAHDDYL